MPKRIFRRACYQRPNISKATVKASFDEGTPTREYLDSLDEENWEVLSFNPEDRQVCIVLSSTNGSFMHTMTLTLPVYSNSWRK